MSKKCFLSFHYADDSWRVSQVKNIGAIDEQPILSSNKWEEVKRKGDQAIEDWINSNMRGKECLVVLIGARTASRRWVKYEIKRACEKGMGVIGIYVHGLKGSDGEQSAKGADPFAGVKVDGELISTYAKTFDPPYVTSTYVYDHIAENVEKWINAAIKLRS